MAITGKGRVGMFGRKAGGVWFSGVVSKAAGVQYRAVKAELEKTYQRIAGRKRSASKADVIEYLLIGKREAESKLYELAGRF